MTVEGPRVPAAIHSSLARRPAFLTSSAAERSVGSGFPLALASNLYSEPGPQPHPHMLRYLWLGGALAMAVFVTGPKLVKMAQIRGWLPGASVSEVRITQMWHQRPGEGGTDRWSYLRDDIFASAGNFVFDFVLLGLELTVVAFALRGIVRDRSGRTRPASP